MQEVNLMGRDFIVRESQKMLIAELRGYILSEKIQSVVIKYPANWIEAIKDRWLPSWAKKKWPVVMARRVVDAVALYPHFKQSVPNSIGGPVKICVLDRGEPADGE